MSEAGLLFRGQVRKRYEQLHEEASTIAGIICCPTVLRACLDPECSERSVLSLLLLVPITASIEVLLKNGVAL